MAGYTHLSESPSSSMTRRSSSLTISSSSSSSSSSDESKNNSAVNIIFLSTSSSSETSSNDIDDYYGYEEEFKFKPRISHRSWSQQGRLWLLQSRRRILLWKRLLVIFGTLFCSSWALLSQFYTYSYHTKTLANAPPLRQNFHEDRDLFQPITPPSSRSIGGGYQSLHQVGYSFKPLLMGYLWSAGTNNSINKRQKHGQGYYGLRTNEDAESIAVAMNPNDFHILKAETIKVQPTYSSELSSFGGSSQQRRSIIPPNYQSLFEPLPNRTVVFDINYTESSVDNYNARFEETDEGMAWPIPEGCEPQYEWQKLSYPTCNTMHEQDISQQLSSYGGGNTGSLQAALLAAGGYRNVWMIRNGTQVTSSNNDNMVQQEPPIALKTLLYERDWYQVQFERHHLDALASAEFQASPYIVNMYGHCGTSGMFEFAQGGNLRQHIAQYGATMTAQTKMELAYNVVAAVTDLHNYVKEGTPWIAHTDIFPDQFIRVQPPERQHEEKRNHGGIFKLNDFNRARWLHKHRDTHETCGFTFPRNRGKFRSPEEYAYQPETEKIDVFSMGNIIYVLLTGGTYPFETRSRDAVKKVLARGKRQQIPELYRDSNHPLEKALVEAIHMCWTHNPKHRATARQVEQFLRQAIKDYKRTRKQ